VAPLADRRRAAGALRKGAVRDAFSAAPANLADREGKSSLTPQVGVRPTAATLAPAYTALAGSPIRGRRTRRRVAMTVARITEISSISKKSFEDAVVQGVARANKTLKNVKGAWVKDQECTIEKGKITGYKVILKVTFVLE